MHETKLSSKLPGFYRLPLVKRQAHVATMTGLTADDILTLSGETGLQPNQADRMVENALGVMGVPLAVCANLRINGRDLLAPMAVEEPSVVAAASYAAKLLRTGQGIETFVSPAHMVGQIQILDVPSFSDAVAAIQDAQEDLLALANSQHKQLVDAGGGALDIEVHKLEPMDSDDPLGTMLIVHLIIDVRDAMGANAINSMCERLAPHLQRLTGGRVRLRILSNLSDRRTVRAIGRVPFDVLEGRGEAGGVELARGIEEASIFAERDPYRAATHNKGVMNGVDAVLVAFGQDWRAVEAGAHAFAARGGRYTAMAKWRIQDQQLVGELEIPMAVGVVGGVARVHPTVQVARRMSGVVSAADLASLTAAVGLAQNLGALRALAAEGIQHGHMRLHGRNVAVEAGAVGAEIDYVVEEMAATSRISVDAARGVVRRMRAQSPLSRPRA